MGPRLGAALWNNDTASLGRRAAELERLGFVSLTVGDHLGYLSPLPACAVLARATTQARIGPLVLCNDFRHPAVLAHEAAALADLSDGRFELGLGAGYNRREYERAGIPFASRETRIARLSESAAIVRQLLDGETVDLEGEHYRVEGLRLAAPTQRVPILIGGNSPELHEVAARHADVVALAGSTRSSVPGTSDYSALAVERQVARIRELAPRAVELHVLVQWHEVTNDRRAARRRAAAALEVSEDVVLDSPYALIGSHEEIEGALRGWYEHLGLSRFTVFADRPDLQPADVLAPVLERLEAESGRG